ncbi:MAG TPA: DUF2334 domain-containing protein [Clostridiales bacterium]|jgi:predicted deacetylase|nr:DUF2334 domain-containing protein [Clostridiales bacterium]
MYILRLDDMSEYRNIDKWNRMYETLKKHDIKPIFAIIPYNEDKKLIELDYDNNYWQNINRLINEGWTPALHGYNHVLDSENAGINPVNNRSEFAGKEYSIQASKIEKGYKLLCQNDVKPKIFVAPAHTFDDNTLKALEEKTDIRIISDTIASDVYKKGKFFYIPQQSGVVRKLNFKLVTFCYHPNTMQDSDFEHLETFLLENKASFGSFHEIELKDRKLSLYDRLLSFLYFVKRKI